MFMKVDNYLLKKLSKLLLVSKNRNPAITLRNTRGSSAFTVNKKGHQALCYLVALREEQPSNLR
jgi:hypothetical protein